MQRGPGTNIQLLYVLKFAKWFMLFMPIIVVFFQDNGLDMQQIFTLKAINAVTIVALEVPSGYMADHWGRKKTLLLGTILNFTGFLAYSVAHGFGMFVVAELLIGFSMSFISGADSAMLYDSLKSVNRKEDYSRQEGRITALGNFSEAGAGILGGFLAGISLRLPFITQAGIAFIGIPAALLLWEPRVRSSLHKASMRSLFNTMKDTFLNNRLLRAYLLFSSFAGMTTLTLAWFVQPYFKSIELPLEWFGIIWTALNLSVAVTAFWAHKVERFITPANILLYIALFTGGGFIFLGITGGWWGIAILFIIYLARGIATPLLKNFMNRNTNSEIRATVLSMRSFVIRIGFAIVSPLLGWYTDLYDLHNALIIAGSIFLAAMLIVLITFRKTLKE
ncbi:MAG: MFS transporter [Bacteroidales bacterium]|nr:MFS transporter [Bacteroidales bacterium]MCF8328139.1 MFS transporter [Bacteroidales bacterium]